MSIFLVDIQCQQFWDLIKWKTNILEQEKDYDKPKRVSNFWNNTYIEYESNDDKNRNLSLGSYLIKIKSYLRDIIIDLQSSDTRKFS